MGTSINKSSPNTPNWSIPRAVLGRTDIDINRQSQEILKAALSDREGALFNELVQPTISSLYMAAKINMTPIDAINKFDGIVAKTGQANLVLDMAKRAFVRSVSNSSGSIGFASELFSEVVSYYASRDLPSYIGKPGRIAAPKDSIDFKKKLRESTKSFAMSIKPKPDLTGWKDYVKEVLNKMVQERGIK